MNEDYGPNVSKHGSAIRAAVCNDECDLCRPFRERKRATAAAWRARQKAASHEGKRIQGRIW